MSEQEERQRVTLEQLHDQLKAAVQGIESGDQWRSWLDFAGKLNRYSFDNLILIMSQRPDATAVAGYTTWKTVHRQVRRGEKSIKVLAPVTRRIELTDDQGHPVLDENGHQQRRNKIVGYRPVPVFDISQTSGPPLLEPARPTLLVGRAPDGLWQSLEREVSERGYRLLRAGSAQLGTANGATLPAMREVWIRDDVDDAQAVKTLAHELAHVILHADDGNDGPCRGIKEVEAESVAYLTLACHGMTTDAYSFPYVAHWAYPIAEIEHVDITEVVARTGRRVMKAAGTIIEATQAPSASDPALAAISVRTSVAAEQTATLREDAQARALPPVERAVLLGVVADSDAFFRSQARGSWVPDYLAQRGLGTALDSNGIGYAPKGWTELTDHLRSLGYGDDHIEAAGMATRASTGHLVDRFRDRLTFPLQDEGDLVGFTARCAPDADVSSPKYLNSPSTVIFKKSELVYGLGDHQRALSPDSLPVICEGPLDAIAVDLAGQLTGNSLVGLATCGTALTDAHARRLAKTSAANGICLAFDGDDAGRRAAERAWTKITDAGITCVTIAELPADTDPASLAADEPTELVRTLREARSAPIVVADRRIDAAGISDNLPRAYAMFHDLVDWAQRLPADERLDLAIHIARRLDIDPADAAAEITERRSGFMADATPSAMLERCAVLAAALDGQAASAKVDHDLDRPPERDAAHVAIAK